MPLLLHNQFVRFLFRGSERNPYFASTEAEGNRTDVQASGGFGRALQEKLQRARFSGQVATFTAAALVTDSSHAILGRMGVVAPGSSTQSMTRAKFPWELSHKNSQGSRAGDAGPERMRPVRRVLANGDST